MDKGAAIRPGGPLLVYSLDADAAKPITAKHIMPNQPAFACRSADVMTSERPKRFF
jgi:hypothetical protein